MHGHSGRVRLTADARTRLLLDLAMELIQTVRERNEIPQPTPRQRRRLSADWLAATCAERLEIAWDQNTPELARLLQSYLVVRHGRLIEALNKTKSDWWPIWSTRNGRYILQRRREVMDDLRAESQQAFCALLARKVYAEDSDAQDDGLRDVCGDLETAPRGKWH